MTNDEINRKVAEIMEPMPSESFWSLTDDEKIGNGYQFTDDYGNDWESPGGAWEIREQNGMGWVAADFCTDIAAAWRCVEWVEEHWPAQCYIKVGRGYVVSITATNGDSGIAKNKNAAMAISEAFIAAFGGE